MEVQGSRFPGEVTAGLVVASPSGKGSAGFPLKPQCGGRVGRDLSSGYPLNPLFLPVPQLQPTAKAPGQSARSPSPVSHLGSIPRVPQALGQG